MTSDQVVRASISLLAHLAEPAARAIALGCLAAIVLGALRVKRAPLRLFAWTTVLYGAMAIALVGWLLPSVPLRVPAALSPERFAAANRSVTAAIRTLDTFVFAAKPNATQSSAAKPEADSSGDAARVYAADRCSQDGRGEGKAASVPEAGGGSRLEAGRAKAQANSSRDAGGLYAADLTSQDTVREGKAGSRRRTPKKTTANYSSRWNASGLGMTGRTSQDISWAVVAAGIYFSVAFVLIARLLLGMFLSHRLARLAEPISDSDAVRKVRFRAYASGLESVPRLAESELVSVPATLGIFRPVILLPVRWREWDEGKFDAILAHEVSHVARRDSLTQRIALIHRAIFWFSPLAWWLDRKLNELAEEASDEAALGAGADKQHYAESLLSFFADLAAASGRVWWQGVSMASDGSRAGHAERRVERILAWKGSASIKRSLAVTLVAVAAPVIFLAAAAHPFIAHAQDKTQGDSKNVIMPGGPKAPALPNAPKGGVKGGVGAIQPSAGVPGRVGASAPTAPTFVQTPAGVITPSSHHPNGGMPSAQVPTPPTGGVAGPYVIREEVGQGVGTGVGSGNGNGVEPAKTTTPVAPMATVTPLPQAGESSDLREAEGQVRAARKQLEEAEAASRPDPDYVREAQQALKDSEEALADAQAPIREAQEQERTIINGNFNSGWGPRYVMMSANSNEVSMSGSEEDLQHARNLRKKISGDFIWFERDEKSYIITDANFIARAKALFAPEEALAKQQDELGRQQDELGRQQDALGEKMDSVKVKINDITPELEEVRNRLKELAAAGATQQELGELQSRLGQLQSKVGRFQSDAGVSQSEIGRQQGELGRKQGELGRRQGELGRQQGELAKKASQQLREMFDDAIAKGIAKPE